MSLRNIDLPELTNGICPKFDPRCRNCDCEYCEKNRFPICLGDIVRLNSSINEGYHDGTVIQVHMDKTVDYFRPYVHVSDVCYSGRHKGSGSLINYIGAETVKEVSPNNLRLIRKGGSVR